MARIVSRIGDINKKPHCVQPIKEPMITQIYIEVIKKAISTLLETLTRYMELFLLPYRGFHPSDQARFMIEILPPHSTYTWCKKRVAVMKCELNLL